MRCLSLCRTAPRRADGAAVPSMRSMATASPSFYETVNLLFPAVRRAIPRLERHSHPRQKQYSSFTVFTVPVLEDTYSYILYDHHSKEGLLVDPCEPELVLRTCERNKISVSGVVNTSNMEAHAGGNEFLARKLQNLPILSFDKRVPGLTHLLKNGELFKVGQQRVRALFTPGVAEGAGVFHILSARRLGFSNSPNRNPHSVLFSGDTLQVGGCGHFSDSAVEHVYRNLIETLALLPSDTDVYCSHEHAVSNLTFANLMAKGDDKDVSEALERARTTRSAFEPTVPAILEDEFLSNPFMRVHHGAVLQSVGCGLTHTAQEVMRRVMAQRNSASLGNVGELNAGGTRALEVAMQKESSLGARRVGRAQREREILDE